MEGGVVPASVPRCGHLRGTGREMAWAMGTTTPAYLLWTSGFKHVFKLMKHTTQGSQGPHEGQSNTASWEPTQAVHSSFGRLFNWNLASSEMPNCCRGSCGVHLAVSWARESCPTPSSPTHLACHLPDLIPVEDEASSHVLVAGGKGWAHWSHSPRSPPSSLQSLKPHLARRRASIHS